MTVRALQALTTHTPEQHVADGGEWAELACASFAVNLHSSLRFSTWEFDSRQQWAFLKQQVAGPVPYQRCPAPHPCRPASCAAEHVQRVALAAV